MKSFTDENIQFGWDSTSIKLAEECLKKYDYVMLQGWTGRGINTHLFFGGAYATALEHFHKYRAEGMDYDPALVAVVREALTTTWIDDQPWLSDHNTKTRENLIRTIVWYLEHFRDDPCPTTILSNGKAAVEHSFQIAVDDDIIFSGHLDRVIEYAHHPYIQDQKTTATTISSYYFKQFEMDTQMSMYTFAGKAVFGLPIKGVMIDTAQIAVGFTRFERGFTFRDEGSLTEWYDDSMKLIRRAQQATRENYFPRNRSACNNYGGCAFREVCSKSPGVRENFLKAEFVKRDKRWDPLEAR